MIKTQQDEELMAAAYLIQKNCYDRGLGIKKCVGCPFNREQGWCVLMDTIDDMYPADWMLGGK